ncbi:MAG: class I SAM-dependent methyltransferase [Bacilli bacterium]
MKKRIKTIASYISPYKHIADIGCDHGYLIKEAIKNGAVYAQAIDNKIGPLTTAKKNLLKFENQVDFSLSSGIKNLDPRVEVIVIAGMGGQLIINIIDEDNSKLNNVKRIITQANKNQFELRKYMSEKAGFKIVSEKIIEEDSIYYEIIVFEKGSANYSDDELYFGPYLLVNKDDIFIKKWNEIVLKLKSLNKKEVQENIDYINKHLS